MFNSFNVKQSCTHIESLSYQHIIQPSYDNVAFIVPPLPMSYILNPSSLSFATLLIIISDVKFEGTVPDTTPPLLLYNT